MVLFNNRGSAPDVLFIGIFIFVIAVAVLVLNMFISTVTTNMLAVPEVNESAATVQALQSTVNTVIPRNDWVVFSFFIGLIIALVVTSWLVSGNPLFMAMYFIVIIIAAVLAMVLSNAWETISQRPEFAAALASLPLTNHLLSYLPFYVCIIGAIGLIVTFGKPFFRQGGDL